jgi:dihydroorotate dehydrogenase (NAD+) catalytic subunit
MSDPMSDPMTGDVDLTTRIGDLVMPTPVMNASGCGGPGLAAFVELSELGAFVTRTVTLDPVAGAPMPRLVETASGVLHRTGGQNAGLEGFLTTELPWLVRLGARTVVSISAGTLGECGELARRVGASPGVAAVELRLGRTEQHTAGKAVHVVHRELPRGIPLLAKLPPGVDPVGVAHAAVDNGAEGLVVTAGVPGLVMDPATLRPSLDGGGLLSGPAIHAIALRQVWDLHEAFPDVPVIGAGGVRTGADALAMLASGAVAVQLGSVLFRDPSAPRRVARELTDELGNRGIGSVAGVVGRGHRNHENQLHDQRDLDNGRLP